MFGAMLGIPPLPIATTGRGIYPRIALRRGAGYPPLVVSTVAIVVEVVITTGLRRQLVITGENRPLRALVSRPRPSGKGGGLSYGMRTLPGMPSRWERGLLAPPSKAEDIQAEEEGTVLRISERSDPTRSTPISASITRLATV